MLGAGRPISAEGRRDGSPLRSPNRKSTARAAKTKSGARRRMGSGLASAAGAALDAAGVELIEQSLEAPAIHHQPRHQSGKRDGDYAIRGPDVGGVRTEIPK